MPDISRVFIKVSLVWLGLALMTGAVMTFGGPQYLMVLLPTHLHMFVVGWVTHMIVGVAIWLFPKASKDAPRGNLKLAWFSLFGLSTGLFLRSIAEPARILWPNEAWPWVLVASAILQWLGGLAFVVMIWPRVKGK